MRPENPAGKGNRGGVWAYWVIAGAYPWMMSGS